MEKTALMQPLQSVAAVPRATRTPLGSPSTADPPAPALRALSGSKPALDQVSISNEAQRIAAAEDARASAPGNNDRLQDAPVRSAADQAGRIMDELKERFFTRAGDENFSAKFDFNSDGVINVQDLGMLREKLAGGPPPDEPASTPPAASLDSIRAAFFTRDGDDGFDATADLNGDGIVNVTDLGLFRKAQDDASQPVQPVPEELTTASDLQAVTSAQTTGVTVATPSPDAEPTTATPAGVQTTVTPAVNPAATQEADTSGATPELDAAQLRANLLDQLRNAFFSREGDDRFDATLDANGDGRINVADFLSVREEV